MYSFLVPKSRDEAAAKGNKNDSSGTEGTPSGSLLIASRLRQAKIDLLERELVRFYMKDDETYRETYDRLMVLVNKIRGLGSDELDDHRVVRILLGACTPRNRTMVMIIRERTDYENLTPIVVLHKFLVDELWEEQFKRANKFATHGSSSKSKEIALKGNKAKEIKETSSSDDDDDEEIDLLVKKVMKLLKKDSYDKHKKVKYKRQPKKPCCECCDVGHLSINRPCKKNKDKEEKHKSKAYKEDKYKTHKKYSDQARTAR